MPISVAYATAYPNHKPLECQDATARAGVGRGSAQQPHLLGPSCGLGAIGGA
jgi:hypothetical protein